MYNLRLMYWLNLRYATKKLRHLLMPHLVSFISDSIVATRDVEFWENNHKVVTTSKYVSYFVKKYDMS